MVYADHEVLLDINSTGLLIVGDPWEISGQQLRPHSIHLLNVIIIISTYSFIIYKLNWTDTNLIQKQNLVVKTQSNFLMIFIFQHHYRKL